MAFAAPSMQMAEGQKERSKGSAMNPSRDERRPGNAVRISFGGF